MIDEKTVDEVTDSILRQALSLVKESIQMDSLPHLIAAGELADMGEKIINQYMKDKS